MTARPTSRISTPDDPAVEMIRHEEQLSVTTRRYATERVRLERVIVTEQRTLTVDVRREEIRLTRESLPEGGPLPRDLDARTPQPVVVILHEERIGIVKTVVPTERVTLSTHSVTEERLLSEALGREVLDVS
ncbi:DUF2382 domain-containing protein [Rathayibacter sp. VKM Ac-2803]|uniref:YsnF/AvaK domain-containing protein n=1 Tax=unclassified Rathayibacter TaxID=2609250 RepID=UPI00135B0D11|nr:MULTISPECIES: YsnF/AvaK domain-containing protein [unclassified Rathayibacter]MWV47980.1 DUF2382 domain-containing protein [Rathayibacter sp. VKM Ac-2803]MWV58795.1 DUF2382 domain-containing protein [Rathayibacter sp. VKM Ac-2754]